MVKKTYKVSGMHCPSCAMLIEGELEDAGMKATCSYVKQTLEVEFDGQPPGEARVKEVVGNAGYRVVDI